MVIRTTLSLVFLSVLLSSCGSSGDYENERRQRLLAIYPPGKTTRADVLKRWQHPPELKESRPSGGWETHPNGWVSKYVSEAEKRLGKRIPSAERYYGADGFLSLCYCWYYYDTRGRLLDVDWQWSSD